MDQGDTADSRTAGNDSPAHSTIFDFPRQNAVSPERVAFDRTELNALFGLYGRKVAQGEWRDYAIDFLRDRAVFSIFRRTSEMPLYRVEKTPRLARKQGAYSVVTPTGLVLKRGADLARVLKAIDKPRVVAV
jgi:hypothetical protein